MRGVVANLYLSGKREIPRVRQNLIEEAFEKDFASYRHDFGTYTRATPPAFSSGKGHAHLVDPVYI